MKRYSALAAIFALAVASYLAGFATGATMLFATGALVECAFWLKVMKKPRPIRIDMRDDARRRRR